jgi:predicted site-specific integrase-resolvase
MTKIPLAAENLGVTVKTIYNWIESGELKLAHPGFVFMSEAIETKKRLEEHRTIGRRLNSILHPRDKHGRFTMLKGGLED